MQRTCAALLTFVSSLALAGESNTLSLDELSRLQNVTGTRVVLQAPAGTQLGSRRWGMAMEFAPERGRRGPGGTVLYELEPNREYHDGKTGKAFKVHLPSDYDLWVPSPREQFEEMVARDRRTRPLLKSLIAKQREHTSRRTAKSRREVRALIAKYGHR